MTSKVEEILDKLERGFMPRGTYTETWKLIDAALAAARSEGVAEGEKVKELLKAGELLDHLAVAYLPHDKHITEWSFIDLAIAAVEVQGFKRGVAEGAEKESRRWLGAIECAVKEGTLSEFVRDALDNISVLAPEVKS